MGSSIPRSCVPRFTNPRHPAVNIQAALLLRFSQAEASRLSDTASELDDSIGGYFGGLDVFHQLHCLVRLIHNEPSQKPI